MFISPLSSVFLRRLARLRLLALVLLLSMAGLSTGLVLADTEALDQAAPSLNTPLPQQEPVAAEANMAEAHERFGVREMYTQADLVVKSVMIFLVFCSLLTWAILFEKLWLFARAKRANQVFLKAFRASDDDLDSQATKSAMGRMWQVSQSELSHYRRHQGDLQDGDKVNRLLQRMSLSASIVQERDLARLGSMMGVLATIGATAPFIGLFGTVWGIMNSFANIATMQSASLAVVAPGIAEALLATALGLFAAIPAVMIFNKFARDINGFVGALDNFTAEMIANVSRQIDEAR
ncbi:MotA/TolQ/ExbB proton channel family protein [Halopseudomonas salegens]|uniref:Outer membrane transport energization protein ExbB n=1 Tax=Halopseudomonas salegens TaxID=1434072 RepID=A0A1H2FB81_9GAMM|nr:MotA/TolQ/ExbB proton channel family protein [Halopseudomonas salegens]SDU04640.1 outer membrane transport energization protein ExbB [Halopseudomonas salegens]